LEGEAMNEVLWLVYLGGVAEGIGVVAALLVIVGGMGCAMAMCIAVVEGVTEEVWPVVRKVVPYVVVALLVGLLMPSKEVLYMAAGLKAGAEVAETELGQKAYRLLDQTLDEMLDEAE